MEWNPPKKLAIYTAHMQDFNFKEKNWTPLLNFTYGSHSPQYGMECDGLIVSVKI